MRREGTLMKRILSLLTAGLLLTFCLVSCANGASIAIYRIRLDNEIENLFRWNMELNSYRETVSYVNRDGSPRFSYQIYYERAENLYSGYNLYEEIGDYKLYAYEGAVYADAGDGLCAVLLLGSTYLDFIGEYLSGEFPFDAESLTQRYSRTENGNVVAEYQSELTPQRAAALSEFGIDEMDEIVSRYVISSDGLILSVDYSVLDESGEIYPVCSRTFWTSEEKETAFSEIAELEASVSVDVIYVGEENTGRHFTVPAGIYVGFDTGSTDYSFYYDEECTQPYSYLDEKITEDLVVYAKAN